MNTTIVATVPISRGKLHFVDQVKTRQDSMLFTVRPTKFNSLSVFLKNTKKGLFLLILNLNESSQCSTGDVSCIIVTFNVFNRNLSCQTKSVEES